MASFFSKIRNSAGGLKQMMTGKQIVGKDKFGNVYYLQKQRGSMARMVDYKDDVPNPTSVPMAWYSWLHRRRENPPTAEEEARLEQDEKTLAEKVRVLDEADAKLRVQEHVERLSGEGPSNSAPDLASVMSSISSGKSSRQ